MVEFGYNEDQIIQPGASAILRNIRPCTCRPQKVYHEDMTANVILRGATNCPCANSREFEVSYSCNIAVPTGGTVGEIQAALTLDGEILPLTIAAATPAAVANYWHVSGTKTIKAPAFSNFTVTVTNASVSATPATVPAPAITMRNLNVVVKDVTNRR